MRGRLFREHNSTAREILPRRRKENVALQREDVLAVEVLVQAVYLRRVLQECGVGWVARLDAAMEKVGGSSG